MKNNLTYIPGKTYGPYNLLLLKRSDRREKKTGKFKYGWYACLDCGNDKTNPYYSDNNIKRDREKDSYCNKNNIILVRIPYTDYHKISLKYILDRIEGE